MYTEGIISLTGAWSLDSTSIQYDSTDTSKWIYFGYGANDGNSMNSTSPTASFYIGYSGSHDIQTLTMLTKAPYDGLNYSNNPTFISASEKIYFHRVGEDTWKQPTELKIQQITHLLTLILPKTKVYIYQV